MPIIDRYAAALERTARRHTKRALKRARRAGIDSIEQVIWAPMTANAYLAAGWHPISESPRDGYAEMTMRLDTRP